ncbi:hypothetical protein [Bacteroides caecigallinarum]|uniref:hypothetical protein n=1 Tax=Bacteroides caecigallinarum TaxID=1411144 RepID=UPI0019566438|nr:hypothetical protein [Bacteroides caecigallinarum]MBM6883158.1 hypothetical protein [Bacteroides caecigallinarum]
MKKTKYLVAALLLMGATTTFTSCIDNDEPAGITELRGAKAELLKAKALVQQAEATRILAVAEYQKALAAHEQANADYRQAEVEKLKLENDIQAARNEDEKARLEAGLVKLQYEMEQAALEHKNAMLDLQTTFANLSRQYEVLLKQIEIAEALMSEADKITIAELKGKVETAQGKVDAANAELASAEETYYNAKLNAEQGAEFWIPKLQLDVKYAQADLDAQIEALEKLNNFLATDVETADWRKEIAVLEDSIEVVKRLSSNVEVERTKLQNSDEYLQAEAKVKAANDAKKNATAPAFKYTYKFDDSKPYGRAAFEIKSSDKIFDATTGKDVVTPEIENEIKGVNTQLARYTTEKIAMLEELLKNHSETVEANKEAYDNAVKAWKDAMAKYEAAQKYNATAEFTALDNVVKNNYDNAFGGGASSEVASAAKIAIANALATYYANAGIVDINTVDLIIKVTINGSLQDVKHSVAEWVADPIYGGAYLTEIISQKFGTAVPAKDDFAKEFTKSAAEGGKIVMSVNTVDGVRAALESASMAAFGNELLVQGEGYMRVIPTMEEVYAVEDYYNKCGAIGRYFWSINPETEEEAKNYKAIIADFEAAITALNGAKASVAKVISEKNAAITAANNEFKVFADKVTAFNNTIAVYKARKEALSNVLSVIVTNVNKYLGLDGGISYNPDTESFEEALKEAVKTAEYAVSDAQKALAEAEVTLKKAEDGIYDAVDEAKKKVDSAMAKLEKAQEELATATANLAKGLEIMANSAE